VKLIKESIEEAKKTTGCAVEKLSDKSTLSIRMCIEERYTVGNRNAPMWERLEEKVSVFDPEGWRTIANFPFNNRVMMFFDSEDESAMYSIHSCKDVVKLLSECQGFVFYLTDSKCNFLLCHNDHDYLIGAGTAKEWVASHNTKTKE